MNNKYRILIIEDNEAIRSSLVDLLEMNDYKVEYAEEGKAGLKKASQLLPDLIVSDIMMPVMDGFEFLTNIRADEQLNHIPVIFLTAKAVMDDKIHGLEIGANDYITKPFEIKELVLRIKNTLENRDKVISNTYRNPKKLKVESKDDIFLRKVNSVIEAEISNTDFAMGDLAAGLDISTSSLQKKIKAICNKSVSQYIREYRLKRSKDLILMNFGTLSQIAEKSGFSSLSYFSRSYKAYFGHSPKQNGVN